MKSSDQPRMMSSAPNGAARPRVRCFTGLSALCLLLLPATAVQADHTFTIADFSVTSGTPVTHVELLVPPGNYGVVRFTADWTAVSTAPFEPWSSELELTITSPNRSFGPWSPGGVDSGAPFTFDSETSIGGISGGGTWSFSFNTSFIGSTANLANIQITLVEAEATAFTGDVDGINGPFFNRTNQGMPPTGTIAGNYAHDVLEFEVDVTGDYIVETSYDYDGFVILYEVAFDPDFPLMNAIAADDDHPVFNIGGSLISSIELTAGVTYILVQTAFALNTGGNWQTNIIGPGNATEVGAGDNTAPQCSVVFDLIEFPLDKDMDDEEIADTLTVTVGQTFVASFIGTDADSGEVLTLSVAGLPSGATLTPGAGASAADELEAIFEWAPIDADAAGSPYFVEITFTDDSGAEATCSLTIFVNRPPAAICVAGPVTGDGPVGSEITLECDSPSGRLVQLDATGSFDPDGDDLSFRWDVSDLDVILDDPDSAMPTGEFPIGITMATLTVTDGRGGVTVCDVTITVVDSVPPEVMVTTNLALLWPPNHQMRVVTVYIVATDECTDPSAIMPLLLTVRSNEPDDTSGNSNFTGDVNGEDGYSSPVEITSELSYDASAEQWVASVQLLLRAERLGSGNGRAYSIDADVADSHGNITRASTVVVVPHDRRRGRP